MKTTFTEKIHSFKIKLNTEQGTAQVQKILFEHGYNWDRFFPHTNSINKRAMMLIVRNGEIEWTDDESIFNSDIKERVRSGVITLPELTYNELISIVKAGSLLRTASASFGHLYI